MSDSEESLSILLVEDESLVALDIKDFLSRLGHRVIGIAIDGDEAIRLAQEHRPQLILMDVGLRGQIDGIQTAAVIQQTARIPVIFLTGHADTETLRRAVQADPFGYLTKPFKEVELHCAIEVAIHKHREEVALREREAMLRDLSLIDELTGLRNRRGFFALAQQDLRVARREHQVLVLFFLDLNGMKQINDELGHSAGDQALRQAAEVLRNTFREADIVARLGGDEFVALARVTREHGVQGIRTRVRQHLDEINARHGQPFRLDMSIGAAVVHSAADEDIELLLARADADMYEEKRISRAAL